MTVEIVIRTISVGLMIPVVIKQFGECFHANGYKFEKQVLFFLGLSVLTLQAARLVQSFLSVPPGIFYWFGFAVSLAMFHLYFGEK